MKIYDLLDDLKAWLSAYPSPSAVQLSPAEVLDKIEELECKHE